MGRKITKGFSEGVPGWAHVATWKSLLLWSRPVSVERRIAQGRVERIEPADELRNRWS